MSNGNARSLARASAANKELLMFTFCREKIVLIILLDGASRKYYQNNLDSA